MKLQRINRPFEVRSVNDDGSFEGYATVFGEEDFYGDIIMPGALDATLARKRNGSIPGLWQHDETQPIFSQTLSVDGYGLKLAGQLVKGVQKADEAYLLLKAKVINGISMGFIPQDTDISSKDGKRHILQLDLWENSLVTFPANDTARVTDVKSISKMDTLADIEQHLRDVGGFSRKEATAIVARIKTIGTGQRDVDMSVEIKQALAILKS